MALCADKLAGGCACASTNKKLFRWRAGRRDLVLVRLKSRSEARFEILVPRSLSFCEGTIRNRGRKRFDDGGKELGATGHERGGRSSPGPAFNVTGGSDIADDDAVRREWFR